MNNEAIKAFLAEISLCMQNKPIETERLLLRRYRAADFADYFEYMSQKELCRLCGQYPAETEEETRTWFEAQQLVQPNRFAIVHKADKKVIGFFSLGVYPFLENDAALAGLRGVSLSLGINENYQRKGLMSELYPAAIDYYFEECKLDFVNSGYFAFNEGSKRIQEKAGMKPYIEHTFEFDGKDILVKEMIIFRKEWIEKRNADRRTLLNALYEPLLKRADMLHGIINKEKLGYELRRGYFGGHYRKNARGEYERDFYPIPEIELRGLCDIEVGFFETGVTAKLQKKRLADFDAGVLAPYRFTVSGVEEWEIDFGDQSDFAAAVKNAENSMETELFFCFTLDAEAGGAEIAELVRRIKESGFYY